MNVTSLVDYRRSRAGDAKAVFEIIPRCVEDLAPAPYPQEVVDSWMEGRSVSDYKGDCANGAIWIAEANGQPIGFGHGAPGVIRRLFVLPDYAGRGIGTQLLDLALKDARANNETTVRVAATLNGASFYEPWGFRTLHKDVFQERPRHLPPIEVMVMQASFSEETN